MILNTSELPVLVNTFILLALSSFFSASETSFTSLSLAKKEVFVKEKRWGWRKIKYLTDNIDRCIITCLVMNNLINIIITAYLTITATRLFGVGRGVTIAVVTGAVLILLFGAIIPKKLAIQYTERVAQITAYLLWATVVVLSPITLPLMKGLRWMWPPRKTRAGEIVPEVSEEEIRAMVNLGGKSGAINQTSHDLIQKVFTLPKKRARDIMTPLEKVISLPISSTIEEFQEISKKNHFSRIPIFTESLNDKDIFLAYFPKIT